MLAIVHDAMDNRTYPLARDARVERKYGAFHETFAVHFHVVLQIREVLHRPVGVNISFIPVSSTIGALKGKFFVEGVHSLAFRRHFPCARHQVANKGPDEKFFRNLDCCDIRNVMVHLLHQMH
jgi:hypothetical protein